MKSRPVTGPATSFKCECGGTLHEYRAPIPEVLVRRRPRLSKNRRIAKKQLKKWRAQMTPIWIFHSFYSAMRPPSYECEDCRRGAGFYRTIARSSFQVEKLPEGAMAIYDRDPEVAELVQQRPPNGDYGYDPVPDDDDLLDESQIWCPVCGGTLALGYENCKCPK